MQRFLLGQLAANGDCLYATILARQIKHDHPRAHLTWAISAPCARLLRNNPDVDEVWEVPALAAEHQGLMWRIFEREALRRLTRHEFDHAWLSQIFPNNFQNYDGTIRPSILRAYGAPITVPIENVIRLDDEETARVARFAAEHRLERFAHRIVFECSSRSGQSFVTPALAQQVAEHVHAQLPDACVLLSTHLPLRPSHPNSFNAGALSLREIAGLTHHATLFVSSGSGTTVAATSTAARPLPMIQLLSASTSVYASFAHDFEHFGLPRDHIVEMTREAPAEIARAIVVACREGIAAVQAQFGERIPVRFDHYRELIEGNLLGRARYLDAARSLQVTAARYGWRPELRAFGRKRIAPNLDRDPGWIHAGRRREAEAFLARLNAPD